MKNAPAIRRAVLDAKEAVFRAQDVASDIADAALLEELRRARWRLEAACRRIAELELEADALEERPRA